MVKCFHRFLFVTYTFLESHGFSDYVGKYYMEDSNVRANYVVGKGACVKEKWTPIL